MSPTASASKKQKDKKLADVDGELCGVCQACATVCPVNAIEVTEHYVTVLPRKCTGCGVCVPVCPVGAITLTEH